jgi:serine/threonine protein kinase
MSSLNHPHLIQTLQTCTLGHKIFIIMPLMEAGSLSSIINYKFPYGIKDEKIIATILKICLETLAYLHDKGYIHRDIKSGNILVSKDGNVKLGDFGVATKVKKESKKKSFVGSFCWMPPEVISSEGYDYKVKPYIQLLSCYIV